MWGPFTLFGTRLTADEQILTSPEPIKPTAPDAKGRLLTTAEILSCYGKPGDPDNLTTITIPYPFRIAWDPTHTTNRIVCHRKVAPLFLMVFNDLLAHYGIDKLKELRIDLFGGIFNFRPQRGLEKKYAAAIAAKNYSLAYTYLSRHGWGIAGDFDPEKNGLKTKWKDAEFYKPEYQYFVDTWHRHGFIGYGPERNYDSMHWEIGILIT